MPEVTNFVAKVITLIINPLIELAMAVAFAYFVWGLAIFILNASDETKRKEGRSHIVWGLIGLFIMLSVFAILKIGISTFCTPQTGPNGVISCPG